MNKFSIFAIFSVLLLLSGCETSIDYHGKVCAIHDSVRYAYNTELQAAYKSIDSSTYAMLMERGPKGSRVENEDIDDEYDGARDLADDSKRRMQQVILHRYCVIVDEYWLTTGGNLMSTINEFELSPEDTAAYHAVKAAQFK